MPKEATNDLTDLIDIALEQLVEAGLKLSAVSTLDAMASALHGEVNAAICVGVHDRLSETHRARLLPPPGDGDSVGLLGIAERGEGVRRRAGVVDEGGLYRNYSPPVTSRTAAVGRAVAVGTLRYPPPGSPGMCRSVDCAGVRKVRCSAGWTV